MDRVIERIIELLTADVQSSRGIKQIYNGEPAAIPKASIPSIVVEGKATNIETITTTEDEDTYIIDVIAVLDQRDYMNADMNKISGNEFLRKLMEERISGISNELESDTILKTIRSGLDSDSDFSLRANVAINYIFNTTREFPTIEGVLTIEVLSKVYAR